MKSTVLVASMFLGACASQSGWSPTVDTYGDPRAQYVSQDQAECRQLALQASGGTGQRAVTGTVVGGLLGAAAGAAIGAAAGSPGTGAAIGAAAGGIGGGTHGGVGSEQDFQSAYRTCMRGRGHNVLN
ncbi:MAG: glycine zipper family protein [Gammaproteobacteria bacterium]